MARRRIAIIGAGASGLVSIKTCLDEGLDPVCLERTDDIGGLWRYTDNAVDGQGCVMKSTIVNTSKEMMCFSDFPVPKEFPNFMHNTLVQKYFDMYCDHFDLRKHIRFRKAILNIKPASDFVSTGQWDIEIKDLPSGTVSTETYDGVLICTGHHAFKNSPSFPGQEEFRGQVMHAHDYRTPAGFEGKKVVVIGAGNSGGDIAVELSRVRSQVFLSTRSGAWVFNRLSYEGVPYDLLDYRRIVWKIVDWMPESLINALMERRLNNRFDHVTYGIQCKHRFRSVHPMTNDELPGCIASGGVVVKPNVSRILKTGVEFDDGTVEENVDVVVIATGYTIGFPFIDQSVIGVSDNQVNLYKYVFPPDLVHPTLAVIGCIQPIGAINPIAEMQARWATKVFKGELSLPSRENMVADIADKKMRMRKRYAEGAHYTIQVDYVPFMDELATLVGCKPSIGKLLLKDPRLALEVFLGPCTPYQYRLQGPGQWEGAREAIMTTFDRVVFPTKTRVVEKPKTEGSNYMLVLLAGALILAAWCFM
ncbi:dimethylaniline monooxygenase [N-oxide-forming] 5-like [Lingula anatina]|uniref:Flavin-containing monooxygenase n=1 Tax=Lingula anatina TaxID=7574 RepID=A0A1S3JJD3_LINAN|nr:dimethylaniline monooxygenase [N-oxide-forming] 5-like [Lingula anatina]|eukprot:XP_013410014.1 dimethylaniline monooxygenase [N-oxide-forming] 5-like [Lingula anatina]